MTTAVKISGYNYTVDEDGNVFSLTRKQYIQPVRSHKKQIFVQLYDSETKRQHPKLVHRLVAEAFVPNLKNLPFVRHFDGDMDNNNWSNLHYSDSMKHYTGR